MYSPTLPPTEAPKTSDIDSSSGGGGGGRLAGIGVESGGGYRRWVY